jgi:hypothetical protein
MCTNTCTASASGKPALAVKTLPLSVIQTLLFVMFYFDFIFNTLSFGRYSIPSQQLHSHLSPIPHPNPQLPSAHPTSLS